MSGDDDDDWLKGSAAVPEPPKEYWDAFPQRVISRLPAAPPRHLATPRRWRLVALQVALALVVLAIGFSLGRRHGPLPQADTYAALRSDKMLREVLAFFPGRVRGIVEDEHGVHLLLSEQPDIPPSRPIWIEIQGDGFRHAAVTFSGQVLQIAGDSVMVLADAHGELTLSGSRVSWSSAAPNRVTTGLHIQAQVLPFTL